MYIYCFSTLLLISFFFLPFSYFYSEERSTDYDIDIDYCKADEQDKIMKAFKNTIFSVVILLIMLIIGLGLRPEQRTSLEHGKEVEWVK
mmetsp:Transcript_9389/g.825  ORF Transcript_9389/g.825 Transcript_9389/m.825 type:complete len:89 (+) Transcript_9389:274-540(+)